MAAMIRSNATISRFLKHVDTSGDCWIWLGAKGGGYGQFRLTESESEEPGEPGKFGAHRVSYRIYNGPIPSEPPRMVIRHTCDNPLCVNPVHLVVATHKENTQDMINKGRSRLGCNAPKGEDHPSAKLTESQVQAIRSDGRSHRLIAAEYGVSGPLISYIKRGMIWKAA